MSGSFNDRGELEISDGLIILAVGKKKSGKSVLGLMLFDSYPGDKLVIDVARDDGPMGPEVIEIHGDAESLPRRWPENLRKEGPDGKPAPMTLRYCPDAGSATFLEDMDAAVGLALAHGNEQKNAGRIGCCLLIHEIGVVAPVNQTRPHMRRALMHNRHNHLTVIACGPRPINVDPLVLQQADLVYTFELLNPADRKRLAESFGWDPADFSFYVAQLRRHEYLRFDANEEAPENPDQGQDPRLVKFRPLPAEVVAPYIKKG